MRAPVITRHARERAQKRLGFGRDAAERLTDGFYASVKVPAVGSTVEIKYALKADCGQ